MYLIVGGIILIILVAVLVTYYNVELKSGRRKVLKAVAEGYWSGIERRRYARFKKVLDVTYVIRKKPRPHRSGVTIDISEGGMKLLIDEKFDKGSLVDLEIEVPESQKKAMAEGEVMWVEDAVVETGSDKRFFYVGVKFSAIGQSEGKILLNYIHQMASDQASEKA